MNTDSFIIRLIISMLVLCFVNGANAGTPKYTLSPLTPTTLSVPSNETVIVQYKITNESSKTLTLSMQSMIGVTQLTTGLGICGNPFVLVSKASCTLSIQVNGSELVEPISEGPIVCQQGSTTDCQRPASAHSLHMTQAAENTGATITVKGSPYPTGNDRAFGCSNLLTLITNGPSGSFTITNSSSIVTATNISSNFSGTILAGNVTETGNTCASVPPLGSCTLTYTPGSVVVPSTNFLIQGSNTNAITAAIQINTVVVLSTVTPSSGSAAGGAGVTLGGSGFSGAPVVTFGGVAATSVHVVNTSTVTAVTPAHAVGSVDVTILTVGGNATLTNGYTYQATAIGQAAYGGTIACLNGGLNNLIAATTDNSTGIVWGGYGTLTTATSTTDGASNTSTIVTTLGTNGGVPYAAKLCSDYEIDSQGNTTCQPGNTCYNDWFLPAGNNIAYSGQLHCLYTNKTMIGNFVDNLYWSSTDRATTDAWYEGFFSGTENYQDKRLPQYVRCVRAFTP